jgi:UDP-N-acetylmuramyl pentapeptide phosphotransferase/UDP-N-acetylglucosamine-1-phosphate transferase
MSISVYFVLFINITFFLFFFQIQKKINIFDKPNLERKIHSEPISSAGGVLLTASLLIYFIFVLFGFDKNLLSFKENLSLIILILFFFLLGIYDDKFNAKPYTRLFFSFLTILILVLFNDNFNIKELKFSFLDYKISLGNFSILFTIICVLIFINACNMFDGINLQFGFYIFLLVIIFYSKGVLENLLIVISIFCFFFLYFNFKKILFIGNNGTLVASVLFSFLFIKIYNLENSLFYSDEIFLYMSILGFDFIRVSFSRLINGRNIFEADMNHVHHLLLKKFSFYHSTLCLQIVIIFPIIFAFLTKNYLVACFISLAAYTALVIFLKKSIKK